jgi:hypothetical protein
MLGVVSVENVAQFPKIKEKFDITGLSKEMENNPEILDILEEIS